MKKYILFFIIIVLPVFSFAQDGANAKKPAIDGAKDEDKPESTMENYKVDQTEVKTKDYIKGEPIELYDLVYMLLPDENAITNDFNFDKLDEIKAVKWQSGYENVFGILDIFINGKKEVKEWSISIISNHSNFNIGKGTDAYSFPYDEEQNTALVYLFINNEYSSKILEKKTFDIGAQYYVVYEVKFPSKKTFWLVEEYDSGTRQGSYSLSFYLVKDEFKKELLNEN